MAALDADKRFAKLDETTRAAFHAGLDRWRGKSITDGAVAAKLVRVLLTAVGASSKPLQTAMLDALAVRDPDAEPITDARGNALPDPDLRDNEHVPLPAVPVTYEADPTARLSTLEYRTAIEDYMAAEVHPYVSDTWVDHDKTKADTRSPSRATSTSTLHPARSSRSTPRSRNSKP